MKMIVISEENFNRMFSVCLNKLKLEYFENEKYENPLNRFDELHRIFHYEISKLKNELEKG